MIVEARLAIYADDGMPVLLAEERRLVVQQDDFEGNVLKGAAALDDLVDRAQAEAKKQVRSYREQDPGLSR